MNNYLFNQSNLSLEAFVAKSEEFTHDVKLKEYLIPEKSCDDFFEVICGRMKELEFSENKNSDILFDEIPDCKFVIKSLNVLGEYYPDRQHIKYYLQDPDILKIIKIHERFHAIHHLTINKNSHIWENFADVDSFYKELLAQLFTYIYIRDYDNALLSDFENLNRSQPFIYQTFKIFQNYDQQKAEDLYWVVRRNNKRKPILKALDRIARMINHNSNKITTLVASTSTFKRNLSTNLISKLQAEPLYTVLHADIIKGIVFPAIRDGHIDFYYKGGNLFKYNERGFLTNIKYAAVIAKGKSDYLTEKELANVSLSTTFSANYERIKENCSIYSGVEANGVSKIYHKHSYVNRTSGIMVLDIEISLKSQDPTKKQDRIDILLYNANEHKLKFVEAKHYSNPEIWSNTQAKVIDQINRYEAQIKSKKTDIIVEYNKYIALVNRVFPGSLPPINDIDEKVSLLIFDFDRNQQSGRLKKFITGNKLFNNLKVYPLANVGEIKLTHLWDR